MNTFYYRHNKFNQKIWNLDCEPIAFNELTVILKGEMSYTINGTPILVKAGDCIYLKSGTFRTRQANAKCDFISFNFYDNLSYSLPYHMHGIITEEIRLLLTVCDEIHSKYYDWFDKIDSALLLIFKLLQNSISLSKENPTVIQIKRFIKNNLKTPLTLTGIANQVGYSPNHCDTLFRKETGKSIIDYLIGERIAEAKRLIDEGILSLKKISESVGFSDYNYFSRTFKKQTRQTPTEYKSMHLI